MSSIDTPSWADNAGLVDFYSKQRSKPEHLYPSERQFLPWLARKAESILDVGCAAGGFRNIWEFNHPGITYTGVDISTPLVEAARRFHLDCQFYVGDCASGLPLQDNHSQVVQALGWLHWESRYGAAMLELWRLTGTYLFFDVRLVAQAEEAVSARQLLSFTGQADDGSTVPYIVIDWPSFAQSLLELHPGTLVGYGYWGNTPDTVIGVERQVCYATFVLSKRSEGMIQATNVYLDLPLAWPDSLADEVTVLPYSDVEVLARASPDSLSSI